MRGAELLVLLGPLHGTGLVCRVRPAPHRVRAVADDDVDTGRIERARRIDNMAGHRSAAKPLQHFRSEEHTSELQSLMRKSYAVVCLKTTINTSIHNPTTNLA